MSDVDTTRELEDICYWLYESSGPSKYILVGRTSLHPDDAVNKLKVLLEHARSEALDDLLEAMPERRGGKVRTGNITDIEGRESQLVVENTTKEQRAFNECLDQVTATIHQLRSNHE